MTSMVYGKVVNHTPCLIYKADGMVYAVAIKGCYLVAAWEE